MMITDQARRRAKQLLDFIDASPTAYQAAGEESRHLEEAGFQRLSQEERWQLTPGKGYYVEIADSTILAFRVGKDAQSPFHIIGAHNDSPGFQLKQKPEKEVKGYAELNVEPYGGLILHTWLDRPLSVAGRLVVKDDASSTGVRSVKVTVDRPLLVIPSLAIHMYRDNPEAGNIKPQKEMQPVWTMTEDGVVPDFLHVISEETGIDRDAILDYDLFLYDVEKGLLVGPNEEFLSVGRLDNLAMAHAALLALIDAKASPAHQVIALHDNEEIGSSTRRGANSSSLRDVLHRIVRALGGDDEDFAVALAKSFTISCDMAHAVHPNYPEAADPTNQPRINEGPVIKYAARKSYITDGESGARVRRYADLAGVPFQTYHNHSDKRGGATIGSMDEQWTGILNADMGNPTLGMHSVREMAGTADHDAMIRLLTTFLSDEK